MSKRSRTWSAASAVLMTATLLVLAGGVPATAAGPGAVVGPTAQPSGIDVGAWKAAHDTDPHTPLVP